MNIGDIILIPFPFAELTNKKVRPAVVITETADKYKDIVVAAISSVVPQKLSAREILLEPDKENMLRIKSVLRSDRIVTLKREDKIANLGKLSKSELSKFKSILSDIIK
jgi:mRNA interferase MazF